MDALVTGSGLVEGPRWDERDGSVWFSDALGGGVFRRDAGGRVETVIEGRRGVGGLVLHEDGGVVASGRTLVHVHAGEERVLAALAGVTGFNDLHADREGRVLAGALRYHPLRGEDPVPGAVWRVAADAEPEELFGEVVWPNGIGISPDGATVYVSDYERACVLAWDGAQTRVHARAPEGASCDGLAVDAEGGLWVALGQGGGIGRYAVDGSLSEVVDVPADFVASVSFGGEDGRDLYIATVGTLFGARADVPGLPAPRARV